MSLRPPKHVSPADVESQMKRETDRLTTEMYNAIKRQEDTAGVNYMKPTLLGGHGHFPSSIHDRRPVYGQLSRININFPGSFLPHVAVADMRHERAREVDLLKRKKNGERIIKIPVVFSRSKTTLTPTMRLSNCGDSVTSVTDMSTVPQKASVADISSLHLEDFSVPRPLSGYLHLSTPKARYMDYFLDDDDSDDGKTGEKESETVAEKATLTPVPVKCFVTQCEHKPPVEIKPTSPTNITNANSIHLNITTDIVQNKDTHLETDRDTKQQRSILKPHSANKASVKYPGKQTNDTECVQHTVPLQRTKPSRVRSTRTSVTSPSPRHPAARSKSVGGHRELTLTSLLVKPDERKRSVRFNVANEIREYAPTEPVCF